MQALTARQALAITDDLIMSAVGGDHRLADVNSAWARGLGWTDADLIGNPIEKFVVQRDKGKLSAALDQLPDSDAVAEVCLEMCGKEGSVYVAWRLSRDDTGIYGVGRIVGKEALESRVGRILDVHEKRTDDLEKAALSASVAETKARTWRTWLAAFLLAASAVGGALAWVVDKMETNLQQTYEIKTRKAQVDGALEDLKGRADTTDKKFRRVGGVLIETQVQVADSTDYIIKKIEAAWPKKTDKVKVPPTVTRARDKVKAIKDKKMLDELFQFDEEAPDDPFAGIELEGLPDDETGAGPVEDDGQ